MFGLFMKFRAELIGQICKVKSSTAWAQMVIPNTTQGSEKLVLAPSLALKWSTKKSLFLEARVYFSKNTIQWPGKLGFGRKTFIGQQICFSCSSPPRNILILKFILTKLFSSHTCLPQLRWLLTIAPGHVVDFKATLLESIFWVLKLANSS